MKSSKRITTLALACSLLLNTVASAAEVAIKPSNLYETEKNFTLSDQYAVNKFANGQEGLGNLQVNGTLLNSAFVNGVPALIMKKDDPVQLVFRLPDNQKKNLITKSGWSIVKANDKKIDEIILSGKVDSGAIVVQKSSDGENWKDVIFDKTNAFADNGSATISISNFNLEQGFYYRLIAAYRTEKKMNSKNFLFLDTSDYMDKWNVEVYKVFLLGDESENEAISDKNVKVDIYADVDTSALTVGGLVAGNQSTVNRVAGEENIQIAQYPHALAAEAGNALDAQVKGLLAGDKVEHTGYNNAKNGADYIIKHADGTVSQIQCKYYNSASKTVASCFDTDGLFRYFAEENVPMAIEVPSDQYEKAVLLMSERIREGKIPGITDPNEATNIVRKGALSYKQAVNLAKFGTIESLKYDAANSCVTTASALGISATVQFALCIWNGQDVKVALKSSIYTGLKVGGNAFITSVLASQLSRAGLNSLLVPGSEAIVEAIGPKAAAVIINATRAGATPIYGAAAMKSAAKLLRGNAIVGTVSLVIFTIPDIVNIFRGRISGKQLFKNLATTAGGIGGGMAGFTGGAAVGSMILPGPGSVIGGIVGGVVAGAGSSIGVSKITDHFVEDDADEMLDIISEEFQQLAYEYLLNEDEAEQVSTQLQKILSADELKNMFASKDRNQYARRMVEQIIQDIVSKRKKVVLPSDEEISNSLAETLEEIGEEFDLEDSANE